MRKLKHILTVLSGLFLCLPLPVWAEDTSSSDEVLPVVFGVLALIGIIIFLIIGVTTTVIAHNTDENSDGL
jgi:hypothetical protein